MMSVKTGFSLNCRKAIGGSHYYAPEMPYA